MTDADLIAAAEEAGAAELTLGDARLADRLTFTHYLLRIDRAPEQVDLSTPQLIAQAPNTARMLRRAFEIGLRGGATN